MDLQVLSNHLQCNSPSIRSFIVSFLREKSPSTLTAYKRDLLDFTSFIPACDVEEGIRTFFGLNQGQANFLVLNYKSHLKKRGLQSTTINRRLAAIRSIVKLANLVGLIRWKLDVSNLPVDVYRDTRGPGKDAFQQMLKACNNQQFPQNIRNKAILRLLFDLALRRSEVSALEIEDIDVFRSQISIIGKGRTQKQILSLPNITREVLNEWVKYRDRCSGPLFINLSRSRPANERLSSNGIYKIVSMLGKRIGLDVRPHGLRHSAITEACKKAAEYKIGIEEVMDFSRHRDIRTLLIYRDRERNAQGIVANLISE